MKLSRALTLARRNLARNRRGAVLSALGVAVGVGCLVFFAALGAGVSNVVRTRILPVDQSTLEVVAPQVSIGSLFGGGALDDAAVKRLQALPGVAEVLPKMNVRVSAISRYNGDFFGRSIRMGLEIIAVGVDPRLVAKDVAAGKSFADPGQGQALPVVVSTRLLELYNKSFASQRNLPTLTPELLTGFRFPAEFGRSFVAAVGTHVEEVPLEVVGFSNRALLAGVTIPIDAARRLNSQYGVDAKTYSALVVRAATPDAVPGLAAEIRRMGFEIDETEQKLATQVGWGIAVVTAALGLLSTLIALLAAVNIAHAFYASVRERRREMGILRAVGASERDVLRVLLLEAALIGAGGGIVGLVCGWLASRGIDLAAARVLPDFPYKPDSFFAWSVVIVLGGVVLALVASVGGAYPPARGAAKSEPSVALSE